MDPRPVRFVGSGSGSGSKNFGPLGSGSIKNKRVQVRVRPNPLQTRPMTILINEHAFHFGSYFRFDFCIFWVHFGFWFYYLISWFCVSFFGFWFCFFAFLLASDILVFKVDFGFLFRVLLGFFGLLISWCLILRHFHLHLKIGGFEQRRKLFWWFFWFLSSISLKH